MGHPARVLRFNCTIIIINNINPKHSIHDLLSEENLDPTRHNIDGVDLNIFRDCMGLYIAYGICVLNGVAGMMVSSIFPPMIRRFVNMYTLYLRDTQECTPHIAESKYLYTTISYIYRYTVGVRWLPKDSAVVDRTP